MKDLKAERIKLFRDQANFIPTERVPHFCNAVTWKVFDAHRSLPIALTNFKVMEDVVRHFLDNYPVDGLMDTGIRNQFSVMEAFGSDGYYYYTDPVKANDSTEQLFSQVTFNKAMGNEYQGCTAYVDVAVWAVQVKNNGETVFDAAGWSAN